MSNTTESSLRSHDSTGDIITDILLFYELIVQNPIYDLFYDSNTK